MKKTLLITILMFAFGTKALGQTGEDIYILGTATLITKGSPDTPTAFHKYVSDRLFPNDITHIIGYTIGDYKLCGYEIKIYSPDTEKTPRVVVDWPISRLNGMDVIDPEEFITTMTAKEARDWVILNWQGGKRRVWVIDTNDFYLKSSSVPYMKLIGGWLDIYGFE